MSAQIHWTAELIAERYTVMSNGCWHWKTVRRTGYAGQIHGKEAYKFVYEFLRGPVSPGLQLDHVCHTNDLTCAGGRACLHRRCVNPGHLEPVTPGENSARARNRRARCRRGHPLNETNTYVWGGKRHCRTCNRASVARYAAKRKAGK